MLLQEENVFIYDEEQESLNKIKEMEKNGFQITHTYKDFSFLFNKWIYIVIAKNIYTE